MSDPKENIQSTPKPSEGVSEKVDGVEVSELEEIPELPDWTGPDLIKEGGDKPEN